MARWRWHLAAIFIYGVESWIYLDHGVSLTSNILGVGEDPALMIWCLAWWPWAIAHHVHSLHSYLLWQPAGVNLAWTTSVPLLALAAMPVTILAGPILSFNLLTLLAPALAACGGYLLCLELFETPVAALIGGWLFGFSSYEAAESFSHLNLDFTVLIPLITLLVLNRIEGRIGRPLTATVLGVMLGGEFLISEELLTTSLLFGAIALCVAYCLLPARRSILRAVSLDVLLAAPIALLLASPILVAALLGSFDVSHPAKWSSFFSIDLLNFFVPTQASAFGGAMARHISEKFPGGLDEQSGYLGLPVILLLLLAWGDFRKGRCYQSLFALLGIVLLASLGPRLMLDDHATKIPLPWALVAHLPLLDAALASRCMVYAALLIAIIVSGWVARDARLSRLLLGVLGCVSLMPIIHPVSPAPVSAFFQPQRVTAILGQNPRLLVLPFGDAGPSSYWQAESQFDYTQAGGYLGYPPASMLKYPAVLQLFSNIFLPGFSAEFVDFCRQTGAQYVIAGPGTTDDLRDIMNALPWPRRQLDDVTIYTVPHV